MNTKGRVNRIQMVQNFKQLRLQFLYLYQESFQEVYHFPYGPIINFYSQLINHQNIILW